jgi:hypothetical protein
VFVVNAQELGTFLPLSSGDHSITIRGKAGSSVVDDVRLVALAPNNEILAQEQLSVVAVELKPKTQSDYDKYLPEEGNSLEFTVTISPGDLLGQIKFELFDISRFKGVAMNFGDSTDPDYDFGSSQSGFEMPEKTEPADKTKTVIQIKTKENEPTNSATVKVFSRDYGGMAKIRARAIVGGITIAAQVTASQNGFLRIPKDDDGNLLPDAGWYDAEKPTPNFISSSGLQPDSDDDPYPSTTNGISGDNLSVYEEYRGFIVLGSHRRTNPRNKDLFIWSNVFADNIHDATYLRLPKHRVRDDEIDSDRRINFNSANSGFDSGFDGKAPGHNDQRCLTVFRLEQFRQDAMGETFHTEPVPQGGRPGPPNKVIRIEIYIQSIRSASPPHLDQYTEDQPYDDEAIKNNVGHEVGHGVGMVHRFLNDPPFSVMTIGWLLPPANIDRWNNIPHTYDPNKDVIPYLRLK